MQTKPLRIIIAIIVIGVIIWRLYEYFQPDPIAVALFKVERGAVEATVANTRTGTVEACRRAKISPITSGRVDRVEVVEGERVEAGQLLLSLWHQDLQAEVLHLQSEVAAARARTTEACTLAEQAKRDAVRLQKLFDKGLTSEDRVEEAKTKASAQAASCQASRATVEVALSRVNVAKVALERTQLKAPFSGVVAEIKAELGEILSPMAPGLSAPVAVDLIDDSCLYVSAPIDEIDAPMMRPGMTAYVTLDAFPGQRFEARVRRIAPYVLDLEKQARTVEVEVQFTGSDTHENLLAGYSADVEIVLDRHEDTLFIPTSALLPDAQVLVMPADGRLVQRSIKTGLNNWQYTEVLEGLAQGEQVVVSVARKGVEAGALVTSETGKR